MTDAPLAMPLNSICGLCWTITYILIIKRGFQDKSYGMPMWPLAINISWEFIYSFVAPVSPPRIVEVHIVWFLFDCIIVYQLLRYWKNHITGVSDKAFYAYTALAFVTSFIGVLFLQYDMITLRGVIDGFPEGFGIHYSAFGSNVIMSILFINMLWARNDVSGQSIYIGLAKGIGTAMAALRNFLYPEVATLPNSNELLFPFFYLAIITFDIIYIILLYRKCRALNVNPWTRI